MRSILKLKTRALFNFAGFVFAAIASFAIQPAKAQEVGAAQVNVHNWPSYIAPNVLLKFTQETGIKVDYTIFAENEELDAKLISGHTGYDVVFPSASPFFARQIKAGLFQKLNLSKIPNAQGLDKNVLVSLEKFDPGNRFGLPYMMYASGFGYNVDLVRKAMPSAPKDSWAMLFDPSILGHFKACGVVLQDTPTETLPAFLLFKGLSPLQQTTESMQNAMRDLERLRPFYRYIGTGKYIEDMSKGNICVAHGYVGDLVQARENGLKQKPPQQIAIVIPKEGALFGMDMMAVPVDAPHSENAHAFINFILRPDIIAEISNEIGYANAVPASKEFLNPNIANDPAIYLPAETREKLTMSPATGSREYERTLAREWAKFRINRK
ncbi:MAG: extracellular solute-binding protein [Alphaproteobacteria bacterium]|nr:extracellular solute-binding protein [Alphaproteobacteria bacterium]